MISRVRLIVLIIILTPITLLLMPVQFMAVQFDWKLAKYLPIIWHRLVAILIGLRVRTIGKLEEAHPIMIISNHVSWMDIVALSTIAPVSFIAKDEVAQIPFAGLLAKLQRSIFVTRADKYGSANQARQISLRMLKGDIMVLFAEGTTGTGDQVLPFKSSLLGAAQFVAKESAGSMVTIQPVSIAYTHTCGILNTRRERVRASWPGTIELLPHAGLMIQQGGLDVEISFGQPIEFTAKSKRRAIADRTHAEVKRMYLASLFPRHRVDGFLLPEK